MPPQLVDDWSLSIAVEWPIFGMLRLDEEVAPSRGRFSNLYNIPAKHANHIGPCAHDLRGLRKRTDVPDAMRSLCIGRK